MNAKWHNTFIEMAFLVAENHSKDPSQKVGAIIVNDTYPLSFGYNGIIRGYPDKEEILQDRDKKLIYAEHAERNAIYNACRNNINISQSTIYCTHPCCHECARAIIQSGIKSVGMVYNEEFLKGKWNSSIKSALDMFTHTGVAYKFFSKNPTTNKWQETDKYKDIL